ncbi:hypothetical protein [Litoribrevibacter albus]|uniref:Uncharacterized protein n=1 Tax=Litoribrevibacter albus TaxID=1473156 RepID=A0AA37W8J6_9GAMM|nr:hypothetical protein [Litoribrevibacter albus]GLQ31556.1 hypothetical protein GCM10007876_20350 [Litoribrevibacter albus]
MTPKHAWTLILIALLPSFAFAAKLLEVDMTVDNSQRQKSSFKSVDKMIDQFQNDSIRDIFPSYVDNVTQVDANVNYRGLPMGLNFALNSTTLQFSIPSLNINENFDGQGDRERALRLLEEYLKGNGGETANRINRELIKISPTSPIAGNPASLMNSMVDNAFYSGTGFKKAPVNIAAGEMAEENKIGIGIDYAKYDQAGYDTDVWNIPISYSWTDKSGQSLTIKAPISYIDQEGSETYKARLGASYQYPVNEHWIVTPVFDYGIIASEDLYDGGQIISGSITSLFTFDSTKFFSKEISISIGNMFGQYETMELSVDDYEVDPDQENTVYKHGIFVDTIVNLMDTPLNFEYIITNARYKGDDVYADNISEFGLSIKPAYASSRDNSMGLTLLYLRSPHAEDISGFQSKLFYSF